MAKLLDSPTYVPVPGPAKIAQMSPKPVRYGCHFRIVLFGVVVKRCRYSLGYRSVVQTNALHKLHVCMVYKLKRWILLWDLHPPNWHGCGEGLNSMRLLSPIHRALCQLPFLSWGMVFYGDNALNLDFVAPRGAPCEVCGGLASHRGDLRGGGLRAVSRGSQRCLGPDQMVYRRSVDGGAVYCRGLNNFKNWSQIHTSNIEVVSYTSKKFQNDPRNI